MANGAGRMNNLVFSEIKDFKIVAYAATANENQVQVRWTEMQDERAAAAYHEAGHAVVALALGSIVRYVELEPDPSTSVLHPNGTNRAIVAAAGIIAERRVFPCSNLVARVDFKCAWAIAERLRPDAPRNQMKIFRARARALLDERWDEVVTVAGALLTNGQLTGSRLAELIRF